VVELGACPPAPPAATVARGLSKPVKPAKPEQIPPAGSAAACRSARHQDCCRRAGSDDQRFHACMLSCLHEIRQACGIAKPASDDDCGRGWYSRHHRHRIADLLLSGDRCEPAAASQCASNFHAQPVPWLDGSRLDRRADLGVHRPTKVMHDRLGRDLGGNGFGGGGVVLRQTQSRRLPVAFAAGFAAIGLWQRSH
jgi:hypothetical protein